jgi:hypothetical protein
LPAIFEPKIFRSFQNYFFLFQSWRWVFWICGLPGFLVAPLIIFTIRRTERQEPKAEAKPLNSDDDQPQQVTAPVDNFTTGQKFLKVTKEFLKPSLLMLCIAGSIRNAGKSSRLPPSSF